MSSFSVGGFEFLGFSEKYPNKLMIISSQKYTILDCDDGMIEECDVDYDEASFTAMCDKLPDEILSIAGQYGGTIPHKTSQGDYVDIQSVGSVVIGNKTLQIQQISFTDRQESKAVIYKGYPIYVCGFSYDGNYFAFANDCGIFVLKRSR